MEQVTSSIGYKWTCIKWNKLQAALVTSGHALSGTSYKPALVTSGRALSGTSYKQHWLQVDMH